MANSFQSPLPGIDDDYLAPHGWDSDFSDEVDQEIDPVLKALRLEAEAEQYEEWLKSLGTKLERAKNMKRYMRARRQLKFKENPAALSSASLESFETEDFMSEPSASIHELHGKTAWVDAYRAKAQQRKKLRKLIAASDSPIKSPVKGKSPAKAKSPVKITMPSPAKIAQAYANQSPAIQQAVAAVLSTPKKFGDIVLDSDDEDAVPMPTKFTRPAKKSFFEDVVLDSPSPIKSPSPYKPKTSFLKKKTFFAPISTPEKM